MEGVLKFCHNCGKQVLKIHQIRQSVPNTNRSFHFSFFKGCNWGTVSPDWIYRKAISTRHDSDRSYVMADILRRSQSKAAEENNRMNANHCHSFQGWCDDTRQQKTKHQLIWTIGFAEEYRIRTRTHNCSCMQHFDTIRHWICKQTLTNKSIFFSQMEIKLRPRGYKVSHLRVNFFFFFFFKLKMILHYRHIETPQWDVLMGAFLLHPRMLFISK